MLHDQQMYLEQTANLLCPSFVEITPNVHFALAQTLQSEVVKYVPRATSVKLKSHKKFKCQ